MDQDLHAIFTALADPTRRQVIEHLRVAPCKASELAERCGVSAPAMSRHLKILRSSGLVRGELVESDARIRLYRLEPAPLRTLQQWLSEAERFWEGQLESFRDHVAAPPPEDPA
jgi:DNA-binding transcriptional ArsR family regulator